MSFGGSSGGSSGGSGTVQTNVQPYAAAQPALTNVAQQFSGAGRTPGSPMMQNQVATQVAQAALPYAFNASEAERARQLGVARSAPSLVQTGQQLEQLQSQAQIN